MNLTHGEFIEGVDYRKTTPRERKLAAWKYVALRDITIYSVSPLCQFEYQLNDYSGRTFGEIKPNRITVCKGYAWDGSTCSPDAGAMLGSLVHDMLYQFSGLRAFPFSRLKCDRIFYQLLETPIKPLYRLGLFLGGWWCFGKNPDGLWISTTPTMPEE